MIIGGLQKTSLIDYPGCVCATIFLLGCNMNCPYCHNPELARGTQLQESVNMDDLILFLKKRSTVLDGVCISGGEPTINTDLITLINVIKDMGLKIKLDTNGTKPLMIDSILEQGLIDYIAMDIKGPKDKYLTITSSSVIIENIEKTIDIIRSTGIQGEFRTTVVPTLLEPEDFIQIAKWINSDKPYVLQQFDPSGQLLDSSYTGISPYDEGRLKEIQAGLNRIYSGDVKLRGLACTI